MQHRATIGHGFVLLVGAAGDDDESAVRRLADKIIDLRVFADEAGKMNLSLVDVHGEALIVSQFTLFADMSRGRRPSLLKAGDPAPHFALPDGNERIVDSQTLLAHGPLVAGRLTDRAC